MKSAASIFFAVLATMVALALSASAQTPNSRPLLAAAETPAATNNGPVASYPAPPATLPGRGLAQHDFLYTGEFDTRKPDATLFLVKGGKVVWTYPIPMKDEYNGQL